MAITIDDFAKVWASQSPLTPYEFSESNYKEGWNFIGGTPPSRQMWDFLQKNNDEKMQYLADNYLPLSGGTMTGAIGGNMASFRLKNEKSDYSGNTMLMGGNASNDGAYFQAHGKASSGGAGFFNIIATDGTNTKMLQGRPDGTLTWDGQPLLPVGIVQAFAGTTIPNGWLLCDGSAVSRTTYANLFAVISTTYGSGDGSTTFNLPDLVDKFVEGSATAGTEHSAGLPNIEGNYNAMMKYFGAGATISDEEYCNGAFYTPTPYSTAGGNFGAGSGSDTYAKQLYLDASRSNAIYGASNTVQPPALTMRYIIKY